MKINPAAEKSLTGVTSPATSRVASEGPDAKPVNRVEATPHPASATVTLSAAASSLMAGADPTFDAEKVASMKQALNNGTYTVSAEAIADKLLANAREVLGRAQGG